MLNSPDRSRAFERIAKEYALPLRRLTGSYAADDADRDDICQEILVAIWTALPRFRGDCSERTWVYRIAHNTAISASLRRNRRTRNEASFARHAGTSNGSDPEAQSIEQERHHLLIEAVRTTEGLDKQILVLYLEGLSNREIAEVVGLSEGAIATRLSRARTSLMERIVTKGGKL